MPKYIVNLPKKDKIMIIEANSDPVQTTNGDTIEWDEVEEHYLCDDCVANLQNEFIPDGKTVVMVGIEEDTSGTNLCEKCGKVATKKIKKFKKK